MIQLDSVHVKLFTDILTSYSLMQLVNFPTRINYFNLDFNRIPFHKIYYVPGINNKLVLFNYSNLYVTDF
nr:unnamed protein product [Callosobruchus chinensis]